MGRSKLSEDELIRMLTSSDIRDTDDATKFILKEYGRLIRSQLRNFMLKKDELDDIFHDTIVALIKNLRKGVFKGNSNLKTYLVEIARRQSMNYIREKERLSIKKIEALPDNLTVEEESNDEDRIRYLKKIISMIDEICRYIIIERFANGRTLRAIASDLKIKPTSINKKYERCMSKVKILVDG